MELLVAVSVVSLLTAAAQEQFTVPGQIVVDAADKEPQYEWDQNGYVIFCPCMGENVVYLKSSFDVNYQTSLKWRSLDVQLKHLYMYR